MEQWVTTWNRGIDDAQVVDDDLAGLFVDRTWTSLRAWGESILGVAGEQRGTPGHPSLDLRRLGVFAVAAGVEGHSVRIGGPVRLLVDSAECGVGRGDLLAPVFAWVSWNELKAYLGEYGRDPDLVGEAISPTSFDEAHMHVDFERADKYVRQQLDPALLAEVVAYFRDPLRSYLDSWRPLSQLSAEQLDDGRWEIVVPRDAVRRVELA